MQRLPYRGSEPVLLYQAAPGATWRDFNREDLARLPVELIRVAVEREDIVHLQFSLVVTDTAPLRVKESMEWQVGDLVTRAISSGDMQTFLHAIRSAHEQVKAMQFERQAARQRADDWHMRYCAMQRLLLRAKSKQSARRAVQRLREGD